MVATIHDNEHQNHITKNKPKTKKGKTTIPLFSSSPHVLFSGARFSPPGPHRPTIPSRLGQILCLLYGSAPCLSPLSLGSPVSHTPLSLIDLLSYPIPPRRQYPRPATSINVPPATTQNHCPVSNPLAWRYGRQPKSKHAVVYEWSPVSHEIATWHKVLPGSSATVDESNEIQELVLENDTWDREKGSHVINSAFLLTFCVRRTIALDVPPDVVQVIAEFRYDRGVFT